MTALFWRLLLSLSAIGIFTSTIFLLLVLIAALRFRYRARKYQRAALVAGDKNLPAVTIFKPVHGVEQRLEENLESFFRQDYPEYEVIIGSRSSDDPAIRIAERLISRYPKVKSRIVISGPPEWPNAKVFTLDKMIGFSTNEFFVLSDSDVRVGRDFLQNVIPPLLDSTLGLVTCLYRGDPAGDFWSSLEGLGMSVEMPSGVVVADMLEGIRFALGPALAVRRDALEAIGGIAATADYYSDDYVLGNKVWAQGYKVMFSHYTVAHVLTPRPFLRTLGDQMRWMKSTRYSRPWGHVGAGLTFAMPFGLLGLIAATKMGNLRLGLALAATAFLNRMIQSIAVGWGLIRDRRALYLSWLYPLRDLQGFVAWIGSFLSHSFYWRGEIYRFSADGKISPQDRESPAATEVRA